MIDKKYYDVPNFHDQHFIQILPVYLGLLHFRCYTTCKFLVIKCHMSIWSWIFFWIQKNTCDEKFQYAIALILKSIKNRVCSSSNSADHSTEIFSAKNYPGSLIFRFIGLFYRVAIFCSGALCIPDDFKNIYSVY